MLFSKVARLEAHIDFAEEHAVDEQTVSQGIHTYNNHIHSSF